MRPDLILLDIGLPVLGGIEAARQIRNLAPLIANSFRNSLPKSYRQLSNWGTQA
jgi:CheY-like chemotaxis protein